MASNTTISRYRPAIAVLAALAAGYTIYYVHSTRQASEELTSGSESRRLRRSNAVIHRRARRQHGRPRELSDYPESEYNAQGLLEEFRNCPDPLTAFRFNIGRNEHGAIQFFEVPLSPFAFPSLDLIRQQCGVTQDGAEDIRQNYETALIKEFLCQQMPPNCTLIDNGGPEAFVDAFEGEGFLFADSILTPIAQFNQGTFEYLDERRQAYERHGMRPPVRRRLRFSQSDAFSSTTVEEPPGSPTTIVVPETDQQPQEEETTTIAVDEMDMDDESEQFSWTGGENEDTKREGQSLLNLLYHIAEDQARREGVVHRGVSCNSCNATPIHGIRYRCTNCVDFDLCEQCEAIGFHQKNHLFVKIRIPTPSYSSPRRPQPVWYPGTSHSLPNSLSRDVNKSMSEATGFTDNEIDAMWDQFKTLASETWPEDPDGFGWAVDRITFDKCFVISSMATRIPPTSLAYDRMFSFYDTNNDGYIGFREFIMGLSAVRSKDPDERHRRIFHGFDYDGDGYVNRRDFLLMFRSYYTLQREFTRELVSDMEADLLEGGSLRDNITGTQPISAAYHGVFSSEDGHAGEGKQQAPNGELEIVDGDGVIAEDASDEGDLDKVIGDMSEIAQFGSLQEDGTINVRSETPLSLLREFESETLRHGEIVIDFNEPPVSSTTSVHTPAAEALPEWPPSHVADRDVERVLGRVVSLRDITNESDRKRILTAAENRIKTEEEQPRRQLARDTAVSNRLNRRQFYLDDEQKVLDSQAIQRQVAQNTGANSGPSHADQALSSDPVSGEPPMPSLPNTPHTADGLPMQMGQEHNLPGGPFREPPPPPQTVGREILYQITQESINELLDPMFKLREDLAMVIINTLPQLHQFKPHLETFRQGKMDELCKFQIDMFQKRWRSIEDDFTLGFDVGLFLLDHLLKQSDIRTNQYHANLSDMYHINMIDKESFEMQNLEKRLALEEEEVKNAQGGNEQESERPRTSRATTQSAEESPDHPAETNVSDQQQEFPPAAVELHRAVRAFDKSDPNTEDSIRNQDLSALLDSSGYSIAPETPQTPRSHTASETPDPTLPQNRPNTIREATAAESPEAPLFVDSLSDPSAPSVKPAQTPPDVANSPVPTSDDSCLSATDINPSRWASMPPDDPGRWTTTFRVYLKYLTMLLLVHQEDNTRGGPGKLSRTEYEELVKGPKGPQLAFLGNWVDFHSL